ncbi:putative reverse transcriptase domain-containing protein [Tanacetum coccineum]|uniref:Reverse transcriptase domain-containing protein n=1 Tax=Tanacetum coccineum TaxID=301880 RepID=A0ABQ5GZR4_9ASTR
MSSDNASSTVTYTSISSDSNGLSWGIPLVNADELLKMDPYEEPEHPEYHAPSDDDIQVEDQPYADDASLTTESPGHIADSKSIEEDSISYPDEHVDDDEDPEEDLEEDHTDYPADGEDGDDEPSDDDEDDDDNDEEPTKDEEEEEHLAPTNPSTVRVVDPVPLAGDTKAFKTNESAPTPRSPQTRVIGKPMRDDIPEEDMLPRRRFVLSAPPPGCDVVESFAARPPREEDVGYVRALQASKHRMMTSIEEVNLRVSYQAQVHRDIRLETNVVRGQRTAYEAELHVVRQAYLSSEARNRAFLALIKTLETHISCMEWQRQRAEDDAVRQMMRTHVLEARAQIDTVEDTGANDAMTLESIQAMIDRAIQRNSTHTQDDAIPNSGGGPRRPVQPARGTLKKKLTDKYCPKGEIKKLEIELWNLRVRGNDVAAYTQRFQELALMCTKFLADETEKIDKYISGLPDNIHGNVMSARPKTLDDAIELANDLMDQKLRTCAERQNDNKRKADDSSRNNQKPHKKQNVARAYTVCPGEKKAYTGNLPLNGNGNGTTQRRAYALGGRDASPDSNFITGTFLFNNCYATILFDTGADRSFVSNTFNALTNITPTTLESHYDVELADAKIIGVNTIICGCTLTS